MFEKALEIQPGHRATLEALIDLYTDAGDFEAVIKQKRALVARPPTPTDEKFALSARDRRRSTRTSCNNPQKAIAAHLEALDFKPNDRQLLHNLLDLFSETKQWKKAMEILHAPRRAGERRRSRRRYLVAAGNIANYELHSTDEAVELYNQALDEDPDDLKAFERIDKIMTAKKDWKNQERNYRKMIKRLGTGADARAQGDGGRAVARAGRDLPVAAQGLQVGDRGLRGLRAAGSGRDARATRSSPSCTSCRGPSRYEKAVKEYRHLIKATQDFGQMAVYMKTLRKLFMEMRQYDRAWCVGAALAFLRKARRRGDAVLRAVQAEGVHRAPRRGSPRSCGKNVYHPDEDRYISAVFATVSQAVAGGQGPRAQGLGPQAQGQARRGERPAAVQQGVQLRQPGAGRARSPSCTCGPSRRASWTWRTRARRRS